MILGGVSIAAVKVVVARGVLIHWLSGTVSAVAPPQYVKQLSAVVPRAAGSKPARAAALLHICSAHVT
jgi:hypothetical protein